ncbi:hypothetical protein Dda3937_01613 [Dickeya dadantii 3937]|uniref:Uncharacterized protein n=1 Tax=Dickeya dadantii (strain 3937) TaxID=198628 RepID=E0SAV8_DICD3|nr:hypothetical protein Dda3937_01613 [Dickeya dadantii 3937]
MSENPWAKIAVGSYHNFLLIAFDIRQFHLQYLRVIQATDRLYSLCRFWSGNGVKNGKRALCGAQRIVVSQIVG